MYYIWHIYFGYFRHSAAHLFVHILLMLWKFRFFFLDIYPTTGAVLVRYSGHSQDMYYIWHIYFGYFGH